MRRTLFDYIKETQMDIDTYDTDYDAIVTVCYIDEENDDYDKFCNNLMKKVTINSCKQNIIIVNWSELITKNKDKFREFTAKYWIRKYEDDEDEFIYQWIKELNLFIAGYVSENMYTILNQFVETLT